MQLSRGSAGHSQVEEQAGVMRLSWRISSRCAGRSRAAHMETIKHMSRKVSRGSGGDYQADEQEGVKSSAGDYQAEEQEGVARLSCRLSSR